MLQRMYTRWAERHGMKVELVDYHAGEQAGIKSATLLIKGENAYGYAKTESGVHRLVRISPYDSSARRHTSFASVWVYPVVDENIDIEVNESELQDRHLSRLGRRRPAHQHHRFARCASPICRPASSSSARTSARSTRTRPRPINQLRAKLYEAELQKREAEANATAASQDRHRLGPPDPLLRAPALSAGEGSAHRRHLDRAVATCSTAISTASWPPPCRSASPARRSRWKMSIRARPRSRSAAARRLRSAAAASRHRPFPSRTGRSRRSFARAISNEDARDSVGEVETVMQPRRGPRRACRSPTSAPARAIIRSACRRWSAPRAGCSPRTSSPRRSRRARPARPARAARQCRDQARPAQRSAAARRLVRPRLHDPHVSRDRAALASSCGTCAPALKRDGRVIVVDADRPTDRHGTPPRLLRLRVRRGRLRRSPASSGCPTANPISPSSRPRGARAPTPERQSLRPADSALI